MKMIQAAIAVLGLALLAGCETRHDGYGRGGTSGYGTYQRGYGGTYGNGTYEREGVYNNGPYYDGRGGWYDRDGYWHGDRRYRR
ncbi:MAG TPA: hypothetical protein VMZ27_18060 [Candidatus Saccharimonadales bacterium]|nr:hypothetical protein [Candidatus Saccharimonadales bacterium]